MHRRLLQISLTAALLQAPLLATEVYLKNGDRLTGRILRHEGGKLVVAHPYLGEITVPDSEVARVLEENAVSASASPTAVATAAPTSAQAGPAPASAAQTPDKTPAPAPAASGNMAGAPTSEKTAKAASADDDDDEPKAHTWLKGWKRIVADTKGSIEFGYQSQDGRKSQVSTSLRANAEYTNAPNNYRFDWRYYYGEYNNVVQTDKKDWTFRWRHDLNKRWFTQTVTNYASDRITHIDMNLEQSAGVGYAALNTNRQKLNIGAGVVGQHRIVLEHDTGLIALGEFFEDYTRKINKRINIRQEALVQYSPVHRASYTMINGNLVQSSGEADNYRYSFNAAIQGKLSEKLSINLRFEYDFDNTVVEAELKSDRRISTTIGYAF